MDKEQQPILDHETPSLAPPAASFASEAASTDSGLPPPAEVPEKSQPSLIHKMLFGDEGLRAGWSLCVYIAIVAVLMASFVFVAQKIHPVSRPAKGAQTREAKPISPRATIFNEAAQFALVLLATWIMSRIEKRPNGVYGLGGVSKPQRFFSGLLWGILCLSLLILALTRTGHLAFDARLLSGTQVAKFAALWALGFLFVGLLEEYLLRGYLQFTLARGFAGIYGAAFKRFGIEQHHRYALGFWTAAMLLSFLFGFGHSSNPGESPIGVLSAGLAGFVFTYSLWRTGSLWWAFGFHASWDWGQSYLYGVADSGMVTQGHLYATHAVGKALLSGGTTGPEGSIYVLPTLALVAFIIYLTLRQAQQPPAGARLQPPL